MTDDAPMGQSGPADPQDRAAGEARAETEAAPVRPRELDPQQLGFTPQRSISWLTPTLLLSTGLRALLATLFGAYLDKRELQNSLPADIHHQPGTGGELWLDYVSDLGDGFDATYSVAYLLAQPQLPVDGRELPRGQVLLMGGDQVYPAASGVAYVDRTKGPYRAAMPQPPTGAPRPTLFALPGNHDWYDGLTAFLRLFARQSDANIGGWCTAQRRSYFAVQLPGRWWLLGIDEQFGAYIDDPQLQYFQQAAEQFAAGDRIILMTPAPTWVKGAVRPDAYDAVDYFVRTVLTPTGADVRLLISGDLHHYARYSGADRELITCGGGGAYLSATHTLPEQIMVPPLETITLKASRSRRYELRARFPSAAASRRSSWGVFGRLPLRNPGFAVMLGIAHVLTMLAMSGAFSRSGDIQRLFSIPLVVMLVVVLAGAWLFAQPPGASSHRRARHRLLGGAHGIAHILLAACGTWVWLRLGLRDWPWPWPPVVAVVGYGPVAALLATQLSAAYLLVASWFGVNVNELFAGQGIEHAKCFLRMHIGADGNLTIYPLGVDRICRRWDADPTGHPDTSWLHPAEPLTARLIEQPIVIGR